MMKSLSFRENRIKSLLHRYKALIILISFSMLIGIGILCNINKNNDKKYNSNNNKVQSEKITFTRDIDTRKLEE